MGRDDQEVQREIKGKEGGMGIWQIWNEESMIGRANQCEAKGWVDT